MQPRSYSIAKLKASLSSILAEVARGREVLVTDHNRPVARLTSLRRLPPLPAGEKDSLLAERPVPLKKGATSSAELVRRLRDEEVH
jgi:prevent-host-death family protein